MALEKKKKSERDSQIKIRVFEEEVREKVAMKKKNQL